MPTFAQDYSIMAPAKVGGGWDSTARAIQKVMQDEGIAGAVEVTNVPGDGGVVGLKQFVTESAGDATKLIVAGYVMVGSIAINSSSVTLGDVTPVARLTGEAEAIAVRADSDLHTIDDLVELWKSKPGRLTWVGGSKGGVDHVVVGIFASEIGLDPSTVKYRARSGGGEAVRDVMADRKVIGISSVGEFVGKTPNPAFRILAVTSEERLPNVDAPTLKELGYDVVVQNWRMIAAAPGISESDEARIIADFDNLNGTAGWQAMLAENGWANVYISGETFRKQLDADISSTREVLKGLGMIK